MRQSIIHVALVVRDYDEAIAFYCDKLRFTLVEDSVQPEQDPRRASRLKRHPTQAA
jgi:catechol 2,3-dioxygenase-like lactoylglutathione lyase family enzyme